MLRKLPVPGRPTIWITVGQGPAVLAVGAGGGCLDIFTPIYPFSPLSPPLWETARYRLKNCLKGPLNPKQPTNQPFLKCFAGVLDIQRIALLNERPSYLGRMFSHPLDKHYSFYRCLGFFYLGLPSLPML